MEKRIKYFTYYGDSDRKAIRENSPAADRKTDYIIDALNRCGYSVDIISHSSVTTPGFYFKGRTKKERFNTFRFFGCFGKSKIKVLEVLGWCFLDAKFFLWCLFHLKKEEQIIVYHSLGYDSAFIKLARLKKLRIIGEIEEIYQDVHQPGAKRAKNEYRFIECCEKYIFPTSYLDSKLNTKKKPAVIIHGIYSVEPRRDVEQFNDGKIHVVYAGTLDPQKGGAAAAAAAAHLSDRYHIHVLGFGDKNQISAITKVISDINGASQAEVTYDGYKQGEDFIGFLQKCQIGLSTQDPTAVFNATSFPSKILTYLSNGLKVVSIRIPAVESSAIGKSLFYYDKQEPEFIAAAITQCVDAESSVDGNILLKELDESFVKELSGILGDKTDKKKLNSIC